MAILCPALARVLPGMTPTLAADAAGAAQAADDAIDETCPLRLLRKVARHLPASNLACSPDKMQSLITTSFRAAAVRARLDWA